MQLIGLFMSEVGAFLSKENGSEAKRTEGEEPRLKR
jgi:hypothetical protein